MSAPESLSDADIDAALKLSIFSYNPSEAWPEYGHEQLRDAYRAGWEDGKNA